MTDPPEEKARSSKQEDRNPLDAEKILTNAAEQRERARACIVVPVGRPIENERYSNEELTDGRRKSSNETIPPTNLESFLLECFDKDGFRNVLYGMGLAYRGDIDTLRERITKAVDRWWPVDYWYDDLIYDLAKGVDEDRLYAYCSVRKILVRHGKIEPMIEDLAEQIPELRDLRIPIPFRFLLFRCYDMGDLKNILKYMEFSESTSGNKMDLIEVIATGFSRCIEGDKIDQFIDYISHMPPKRRLKEICESAHLPDKGKRENIFYQVIAQVPELREWRLG